MTTKKGRRSGQPSEPSQPAGAQNGLFDLGGSDAPKATGFFPLSKGICPQCGGRKAKHAFHCLRCHQELRPKPVELVCSHCGKGFVRQCSQHEKALARGEQRVFCSKPCYVAAPKLRRKERGFCIVCAAPLTRKDQRIYCGTACYHQRRQAMRETEQYSGAYQALRTLVRSRDKSCALCGISKTRVGAHHIDHNPENNVLGNLILLCQLCHKRYHTYVEPVQTVLRHYFLEKVSTL